MSGFDLSNLDLPDEFEDDAAGVMVLVALPAAKLPDAGALLSYLSTTWPDMGELGDMTAQEDMIGIEIPGGGIGCELVTEPIPEDGLEAAYGAAWYWPDAQEKMADHTAHIVIYGGSMVLDDVDIFLIVTKIAAALAVLTNAQGIVWGTSGMVHEPGMFLEQATTAQRDNIPIMLWIGCLFARVSETEIMAYTSGMNAFDLMDIETAPTAQSPAELFALVLKLAAYLISNGPVLEDGESVTGIAAGTATVYHAPSDFEEEVMVYRIEFS